jgi:hypothetical protein
MHKSSVQCRCSSVSMVLRIVTVTCRAALFDKNVTFSCSSGDIDYSNNHCVLMNLPQAVQLSIV